MTAPTANWSYPTAIRFGAGRIKELARTPAALREFPGRSWSPMPGLAKLPITLRTLELMKDAGLPVAMFSDVQPNPWIRMSRPASPPSAPAATMAVVAFGGGSGLDTGKVIAFMAGQTRPLWDFEDIGDWWTRADADKIAAVIAVPTTAGTGSEVGRAGVITQEATHTKKVIFHPKMMPRDRDLRSWSSPSACRRQSPPAPAWMRSPIVSRPIAPRATIRWRRALPLRACGSFSRTCPRLWRTGTILRPARI